MTSNFSLITCFDISIISFSMLQVFPTPLIPRSRESGG